MSNDFSPSLIPPGAPIPDPPGANLPAKIPIFLVGCGLLLYLIYNVRTEVIYWKNFRPRDASTVLEEGEAPSPLFGNAPLSKMLTHSVANDPKRCHECHEPAFSEEMAEILPGPFWGDQSCLVCHPLKDFEQQHFGHQFEPLKDCTMCHSPHKSIEKPLMKETYLKACTLCHPLRMKNEN